MFNNHQVNDIGKDELYIQQIIKWIKCQVKLKSRQSLVRLTITQSKNAPINAFKTNASMTPKLPT